MLTLLRDGGIPMWFILAFGLVSLVTAIRYAMRPEAKLRGLIKGMSLATLAATISGTAAALAATFQALAGNRIPEMSFQKPEGVLVLFQGLSESMSAFILGFALLALTAMFCGVGNFRKDSTPA